MQNILGYRRMITGGLLLFCLYGYEVRSESLMEVASGIYLRPGVQEVLSKSNHGHIANIGFIVGTERVAVIDTGSTYQEGVALRRMIGEVTDLPIEYVILTHMHLDHSLGAAAFSGDKPVFIGHEHLADALIRRETVYLNRMSELLGSEAEASQIVLPDQTVAIDQVFKVDLGGRTLQLRAFPTAHTNNDLSIYDESTRTLWLSDLLFVERIPIVDGSLLGWQRVIDDLDGMSCVSPPSSSDQRNNREKGDNESCLKVERIVPGHGPVVSQWRVALADQRRYLDLIANGIRQVIKRGGTITQAVESVGLEERDNWLLFDEFHGRNVTTGFAELEWE